MHSSIGVTQQAPTLRLAIEKASSTCIQFELADGCLSERTSSPAPDADASSHQPQRLLRQPKRGLVVTAQLCQYGLKARGDIERRLLGRLHRIGD